MVDTIQCSECPELVPDDSALPDEQRTPCPKCGSRGRVRKTKVIESVGATIGISWNVYTREFIETARDYFNKGEYSVTVLFAHTACEIASEQAFSRHFADHGLSAFEESISKLIPSFSMMDDRVRKLHTALSGKQIGEQSFWSQYTDSVRLRNKVIHEGKSVTRDEANNTLNVIKEFIEYLK